MDPVGDWSAQVGRWWFESILSHQSLTGRSTISRQPVKDGTPLARRRETWSISSAGRALEERQAIDAARGAWFKSKMGHQLHFGAVSFFHIRQWLHLGGGSRERAAHAAQRTGIGGEPESKIQEVFSNDE